MIKKIFVYGSLMEGFFNYDKYLQGKVLARRRAKVKGHLYHLTNKGYPALIEGADTVYGEVIEVKDFEETLKHLDRLENYSEANQSVNEYNRVVKEVDILDNHSRTKAYVYQYNCDNKRAMDCEYIYLPHGDWRYFMEIENRLSATC